MAQRTMCLCEGKYIGIESIFTVVNGRQINIPEKVEELREKSRRNQLTCPCGCGAILTLVAGDRNLREQHFRLKEGEHEKDCHLVTEGKRSVDSKIVLKCWLDDKLQDANIESRVPISAVENHERKYEFTLLSRTKSIAVSYSHERVDLSDEKFDILQSNSKGIRIIYIVDALNGGANGQYPESLMKIQTRQGYCLYLSIDDIDYYKAKLKAVCFEQDIDGLWQEITFASGLLSQFDISEFGDIFYLGKALKELLEITKDKFAWEQESIRQKRERERIEREEYLKKIIEENAKCQEEKNKEMIRQKEEAERRRTELAEKQRLEAERKERDRKEKEFSFYGGAGRVNLGTCYDCSKNTLVIHEKINHPVDYKLISICHRGDIVVSQDYGVAAMALGKGAFAIHQSGKWYTVENIDRMLMERHLNKKARRGSSKNHIKGRTMSGGHRLCADRSGSGDPKKRTSEDDERFAQSFEKLVLMAQAREGEQDGTV